jgi:transglutaminase-like putative cysteine protease
LPREVNIPSVSITASLHTTQNPVIPTTRKAGPELLAATEFWPSDDSEIMALAAKITVNCNSPEEKTEAILRWLLPGKNIKFMETVTSARSGVKNMLRQKSGQSWDFSDCFITLARASKVPCRQVGGWFYSQSAHVWAEVLYEGSGWQPVEPTGGGIANCGIYHIAYITSENGKMSFIYLSKPKIEFIDN